MATATKISPAIPCIFPIDHHYKRHVCKTVDRKIPTVTKFRYYSLYPEFLCIFIRRFAQPTKVIFWMCVASSQSKVFGSSEPGREKTFLPYAPGEQFSVKWMGAILESGIPFIWDIHGKLWWMVVLLFSCFQSISTNLGVCLHPDCLTARVCYPSVSKVASFSAINVMKTILS